MFKNENGFSLVELAIAAGLAVALAATAVTILSGTTANLSSKANGAAGTSTTYNSDVLANASGAAGSGSQTPAASAPTFASVTSGISLDPMSAMMGGGSWNEFSDVLAINLYSPDGVNQNAANYSYSNGPIDAMVSNGVTDLPSLLAQSGVYRSDYIVESPDAYTIIVKQYMHGMDKVPMFTTTYYKMNAGGNIIAW